MQSSPSRGTIVELAEKQSVEEATKRVLAVEHTMALENQAPGDVNETIVEETKKRLLKRPRSRTR